MMQIFTRLITKILQALLFAYQCFVSPFLPRSCIFKITCSNFAKRALKKYPVFKAIKFITLRLLMCNNYLFLQKIIRRKKLLLKNSASKNH